MKPVLVTWIDAATQDHMDWEPRDVEAMEPETVYTLGFLRHLDAHRVELCMAHGSGQICGRFQIPRACVLSIDYLTTDDQSQDQPQG